MSFLIIQQNFRPQPGIVHFVCNKKPEGLRRLWAGGYTSFDEDYLPGETASRNVEALLRHLGVQAPRDFASLALRYVGEHPDAGGTLAVFGCYTVEVRQEVVSDAVILNGDVKNLARSFVDGAHEKAVRIHHDPSQPTQTLQRLAELRRSRVDPRLVGLYQEVRLLRALRRDDVVAVWSANPERAVIDFLISKGGVEVADPTRL